MSVRYAGGGGGGGASTHVVDTYANRPAASSGLEGARFFASDKLMEWQCVSSAWVLVGIYPPLVTSLPASPIDQQEIYLQVDATNGVNWRCRYNSASAYALKWEVVGGPPLEAAVATSEICSSQSYGNLATVGPSITTPAVAIDANITAGANIVPTSANQESRMSYAVGGTGASDAWAALKGTPSASFGGSSASMLTKWSNVAASSAIVAKYINASVGNANFAARYLTVAGLRVG